MPTVLRAPICLTVSESGFLGRPESEAIGLSLIENRPQPNSCQRFTVQTLLVLYFGDGSCCSRGFGARRLFGDRGSARTNAAAGIRCAHARHLRLGARQQG